MANKIDIVVNAKDNASKELKNVKSSTDKLSGAIADVGKIAGGFLIAEAFQRLPGVIGGAASALGDWTLSAAKARDLSVGFERNFGNVTEGLDKLRESSRGTIDDTNLMLAANRASLLGVTDDVGDLGSLMETARLRGREMGLDMTTAFDRIVTGIGRGSPLILDDLGIKIPDALKATMEGMTDVEKTAALTQFAIEDGKKIMAEYGEAGLTAAEKYQRLQAQISNAKGIIGDQFVDAMEGALDVLYEFTESDAGKDLINGIGKAIQLLGEYLEGVFSGISKGMPDILGAFGGLKDSVVTLLEEFGLLSEKAPSALGIGEQVGGGYADVIQTLVEGATKFVNYLTSNKDQIIETFTNIKNTVSDIVNFFINNREEIITFFTDAVEYAQIAIGVFKTIVTTVIDIRNKFMAAKDFIINAFNTIYNSAVVNFTMVKDFVFGVFESVKAFIQTKINQAKHTFRDLYVTANANLIALKSAASGIIESIKSKFQEIKTKVENVFSGLKSTAETAINDVLAVFSGLGQKIVDKIGSISIPVKIDDPTGLVGKGKEILGGERALGGRVSGGESYLVGERGPEIFTPGGAGNITPNNQISNVKNTGGNTINIYEADTKQAEEIVNLLAYKLNV